MDRSEMHMYVFLVNLANMQMEKNGSPFADGYVFVD